MSAVWMGVNASKMDVILGPVDAVDELCFRMRNLAVVPKADNMLIVFVDYLNRWIVLCSRTRSQHYRSRVSFELQDMSLE